MTTTQEFYITLPSNVKSGGDFEYNRISSYKTILQKRIEFPRNEKWHVALAEISYTKSWYNIQSEFKIKYFNKKGEMVYHKHHIPLLSNIQSNENQNEITAYYDEEKSLDQTRRISPGKYNNIEEVVELLTNKMSIISTNCDIKPRLEYDKFNLKVTLHAGLCSGHKYYPNLGEEVEQMLGFCDHYNPPLYMNCALSESVKDFRRAENSAKSKYPSEYNYKNTDTRYIDAFTNNYYTSIRPVDINASYNSLYVYCDNVEHNLVGNTIAQLLRAVEVPSEKKYGDVITLTYNKPHYIPLQTNCFDTIHIAIKDDTGENIKFEFGRVLVKLIFKKI